MSKGCVSKRQRNALLFQPFVTISLGRKGKYLLEYGQWYFVDVLVGVGSFFVIIAQLVNLVATFSLSAQVLTLQLLL